MPLKTRPFLDLAKDAALEALGSLRPEARVRSSMVQLFFDEPRQHYELWLRLRDGLVELGLHFEGEREDSLARIAVVADAMPLVLDGLGPEVEVEEWTERWTRVHETGPLLPLEEGYARDLGRRLAAYVETLQPIVGALGPMAPAPPRAAGRGRWERGKTRPGQASGRSR
jgi:hypothetical protein